jgi:hypothetical protein
MSENFGIFYTCYTEKEAVAFSLRELFKIYPSIPVYLVSDGGEDYSFLEKEFSTIKTFLEEDSRGIIPKIPSDSFREEQYQIQIKKSILTLILRIERAIEYCNKEYMLIMEPDILVRGIISIPQDSKLLGSRINKGLSEELKLILRNTKGAIEIDNWGATPAIFESKAFIDAANKIKNDENLFNGLCLSEYRLAFYDVLFSVMFALLGYEEQFNPEITECFRNPNWQYSGHPLLHQYRAKYPLSSQGYDGTHTKHIHGLGDHWKWQR